MKKKIFKVEIGDPCKICDNYHNGMYNIQFGNIHSLFPDGPQCGDLSVNGKKIPFENYDGFGNPIIIAENHIYTPLYKSLKWSYSGLDVFIAEIELSSYKFRILGKKMAGPLWLSHLEDNSLYYYNPTKEEKNLKKIDLTTGYQPLTWWEEIFHWLGISKLIK